ncbi:MAG: LPP20 family lipoprotein [Gammaproteobacteria bacterium]|nr:LPP20 family lipoprotein [Gammaproteobacteria bacterium]MCF6230957.1 LPP20 family lipoprotein [Gammaproteobacteria bacterium]
MYKRYPALLVLLITTLLVGCQTAPKQKENNFFSDKPDWILNTPIKSGFIYGVGSAEVFGGNETAALSRAKDFARIELIKQIEVEMQGSVEQEISEITRNNKSEFTEQLRQTVSSRVPEFKLSNVEQVDSHHDKKNRQVAVLVKFDVNQEILSLKGEIRSLDQQLHEIDETLSKNQTKGITRLRTATSALVLADQRAGLQARLNQLQSGAQREPLLSKPIRQLIAKVYKITSEIKVALRAEQKSERALQVGLIAQLTKRGLTVSEEGAHDIEIVYAVSSTTIKRGDMNFVVTEGNIWVKDDAGKIINAVQKRVKGASIDPKLAHSRAIEKLSESLGEALVNALF